MARGVNHQFYHIVQSDRDTYRNWLWIAGALALALFAPAYFLYPWLGAAVHAGALALGLGVGLLLATRTMQKRQEAIANDWNGWMAAAEGRESMRAVWRAWQGKHSRRDVLLAAMAGATFWTLQVILVLLALSEPELLVALPFLTVNGILAGLLFGALLRSFLWLRAFADSLAEMVDAGEIGVWGVR
ncbi:MAG: hypothetical protein ACPHK8_02830 [Thermoplasmatota archaeon]